MNLRPRRKHSPDLNLTPLIDVVFLLLIFFMVSTTFDRETRIHVRLPEAEAEEKTVERDVIEVKVDAEGRYYVNDQEVINTQAATLKRALEKARGDASDIPLVIRADAKTPHQAVITVMDMAGQLGLIQITFATKHPN